MIERNHYLSALIKKKDNGRIKIITGIRRCGKSFLLFKLYKDYLLKQGVSKGQFIEIALDELENVRYRNPFELNDYIRRQITKDLRYYIFIDEIQFSSKLKNPYVEDADEKISFVDTLLGLMKHTNLDIYVTGSNSSMLSQDILTQFRDRGDEIHVNPLSFGEVYAAYEDKSLAWRDYLVFGGMPYVLSLDTVEEKSHYLKKLFEETYLKDIIERNRIQNEEAVLGILLDFVSSSVGSLTNPSKLSKRFFSEKKINISHNTIANYLSNFEEAYLLHSAKRYDIKGAKYFSTPLKYYFADIGLRNARLNFRQIEETHSMENILYNDLCRRGYNVDVGVVEAYSASAGKSVRTQLEVDFVLNRGHERYYIQSALRLGTEAKKEQEINSLRRINDSFKKVVVVKDELLPRYDEHGIFFIGVKDFLLRDDVLS